jgi:hypothetical protein
VSEIKRKYYVGEEETSKQEIQAWRDAQKPYRDAMKGLKAKYGNENVWVSRSSFGETVKGLLFGERPEDKKGWKIMRIPTDDGPRHLVEPDRRYKVGKELAEDMRQVNKLAGENAAFSTWFISRNKLDFSKLSGRAMHVSAAGFLENKVIVTIPAPDSGLSGDEQYPDIPAWLHEIKKSEFIALTEE